mmetsp:Transcript_84918/g.218753  ORF Transcript_84918/g.218753 Transcript_84918/m.218753 type:complete len:220 (+) Transcript_84918:2714-3373(+)
MADGSRSPTSWLTSSSSHSDESMPDKQSITASCTVSLGTSRSLKSKLSRPCLLSAWETSAHASYLSTLAEKNFKKSTTELIMSWQIRFVAPVKSGTWPANGVPLALPPSSSLYTRCSSHLLYIALNFCLSITGKTLLACDDRRPSRSMTACRYVSNGMLVFLKSASRITVKQRMLAVSTTGSAELSARNFKSKSMNTGSLPISDSATSRHTCGLAAPPA